MPTDSSKNVNQILELPPNLTHDQLVDLLNDRFRDLNGVLGALSRAPGKQVLLPAPGTGTGGGSTQSLTVRRSLAFFGAKGDCQASNVSVTVGSNIVTWISGAKFAAADAGKRIIIYGGGSGRDSFQTGAPEALDTIDSYASLSAIDAQGATKVAYTVFSKTNDTTFEISGANLADYSDEVVISGPTNQTALTASTVFSTSSPTKRYYRAKIKNKTAGLNATAYVTGSSNGLILSGKIVTIVSSTQVIIDHAATSTRDLALTYFGTDDTAAIQLAFDTLSALVPSGTADGGSIIEETDQRMYLISAPITHRRFVVFQGVSAGGTIFVADGQAFPINTPVWNITGTFASDTRIAFWTRLVDVRIDCGFVPGSTAVFCDALQEHSQLCRVAGINWGKYGCQVDSPTDQFGSTNWIIEDGYFYPGVNFLGNDTLRGLTIDFAPVTTVIRGTYMGQGGFTCGFGECIEVKHGTVYAFGEIHCESGRIGWHWNSGSSGSLAAITGQSFVQALITIEAGNPVSIGVWQSAGELALNDVINAFTDSATERVGYLSTPVTIPTFLGTTLLMPGDITGPNVVAWNNLNFGQPEQGGWFSVNSRANGYPNWLKTSRNASNEALFIRFGANTFEVRKGPATQPVYVSTGVCNVAGTAVTWVSGAVFDVTWPAGSQIIVNGGVAARIATVNSTTSITLQGAAGTFTGVSFGVSTDPAAFGGTDPGVLLFKINGSSAISSLPIFPQASDATGPAIYVRATTPEGAQAANPGSVCFTPTFTYRKASGSGTTGWVAEHQDFWTPVPSDPTGSIQTTYRVGIDDTPDPGAGEFLAVGGLTRLFNQRITGYEQWDPGTAMLPLMLDAAKKFISKKFDLHDANHADISAFNSGKIPKSDGSVFQAYDLDALIARVAALEAIVAVGIAPGTIDTAATPKIVTGAGGVITGAHA